MNSTVFKTFPARRRCEGGEDGPVCGARFSQEPTDVFSTEFFCKISNFFLLLLCSMNTFAHFGPETLVKLLLLWFILKNTSWKTGNRFSDFLITVCSKFPNKCSVCLSFCQFLPSSGSCILTVVIQCKMM